MKPLNLDNSPCSPVSSNCVIWQGPNIDCISLCTGDSISTVIYNLATELCTIMNQLDLSNLDLTCLQVGNNPPDTFSELIQLLINKICNAGTGTPGPAAITDPCPTNCIVPIADCFKTSATQTTMLLLDYVQMIGEKVCSLVDQIGTINTTITSIDNRVTILENLPPPVPYVLPSFIVDCTLKDNPDGVLAGTSHNLEVILTALVNDDTHGYCALLSSLGQPGNVFTAYNFQSNTSAGLYVPTLATSPSLFNCGTAMQSEYTSWIATPQNLSDSFINLWITVSDIRKAHKTYEVKNVTGDTSVNITTTTATTACGKKDTVTVSANLPIVAAGNNITVTPVTSTNITTYTVDGKDTIVQQGANITVTQTGPTAGDTTYTVNAKGILVQDTSSVNLTVTSDATDFTIRAVVNDTGWVDLEGFSWFVDTPTWKPQCRRIGNVVYFRGALMVPLQTSAGAVIPYTYGSTDTYCRRTEIAPFIGTGGVDIDNNGAIFFNNDTRVVPLSVVGNGVNFDQSVFSSNYVVASRYIIYNNASGATTNHSGILHSVCKIFIYSDKRMALQILKDNEYSAGGVTGNIFGTSALNSMVSRVYQGDRIQRWRTALNTWPDFHSSNTMDGDTTTLPAQTAGVTPVTPNHVVNNVRQIDYDDDYRFPFQCEAGEPNNLGGFGWIQLEGMTATLAPCNTDIKNIC